MSYEKSVSAKGMKICNISEMFLFEQMTAAETAGVTIQELTKFQILIKTAVSTVVPKNRTAADGETDLVEDYTSHYSCCPPPLFMITISVVEVIFTVLLLDL